MKLHDIMCEIEKLPFSLRVELMVHLTRHVAEKAIPKLPSGPVRHAQIAVGVVSELRRVLKNSYGEVKPDTKELEMEI